MLIKGIMEGIGNGQVGKEKAEKYDSFVSSLKAFI